MTELIGWLVAAGVVVAVYIGLVLAWWGIARLVVYLRHRR